MKNQKTVYIVDDEKSIRELLVYNLEEAGFKVKAFSDGTTFLEALKTKKPDLICLDVMLPDYNGVELCKKIRGTSEDQQLPIFLLTAKVGEFDTIIGLEAGADDYIRKPFSVNELIARIRAFLRRQERGTDDQEILYFKEIEINKSQRVITFKGEVLKLTLKEYELFVLLLENKGRVYSRAELLDHVWGYDYFGESRTVDVHIHSIRKILHDDGEQYIQTVRGIGYKFIK